MKPLRHSLHHSDKNYIFEREGCMTYTAVSHFSGVVEMFWLHFIGDLTPLFQMQ